MNSARDQILSGAAFSLDQNSRGFTHRYLLDEFPGLLYVPGNSNDLVDAELASLNLLSARHFGSKAAGLQRIADHVFELLEIDGLLNVIVGAEFQTANGILNRSKSGNHDDRHVDPAISELFQNLEAAHVGQLHIE